ncbi:hypothetical protein OC842_004118 [Tilletia horrida]|uniref:Hepatocellular carcinoma-associated antigen 59-domain-containing protein n=1 Tax=Tilletia horrida TaxID=155126 RepID=A0AAN6GEZ3_9BASI|nr:hypothetical protein OC842_004118 [Tilletia horrida]KAK0560004.1 hypothetical protein OC844_004039 [Tilletia horrida]
MADAQEPVFKKRKRGPVAASGGAGAADAGGDDAAPSLRQLLSSGSPDDGGEDANKAVGGAAGGADNEDDEATSVQDLLLLRQLQKRPTGIELNKLNKGERKKKKKASGSKGQDGGPQTAEDKWAEQMARGGLMDGGGGGGGGGAEEEDDDEKDRANSKRIVRNNFQGETNIVDVDKHMMAYIEEEMRKRSGRGGDLAAPSAEQVRAALNNPEDELYRVAEKYRNLQSQKPVEDEEGNVTLSNTMLTSIPEIDLGMDVRLKNIEETEKAKRVLAEQRKAGGGRRDEGDDQFAAARFYRPKYSTQSDVDALKMAREGYDPTSEVTLGPESSSSSSAARANGGSANRDRRAMATDEQVMERFKKRQRQQLK